MCLHFLVHFDEGFGKTVLYQHKSKLGRIGALLDGVRHRAYNYKIEMYAAARRSCCPTV